MLVLLDNIASDQGLALAYALAFYGAASVPVYQSPLWRYSNRKVGGIRFVRIGRVFCSFGISK